MHEDPAIGGGRVFVRVELDSSIGQLRTRGQDTEARSWREDSRRYSRHPVLRYLGRGGCAELLLRYALAVPWRGGRAEDA